MDDQKQVLVSLITGRFSRVPFAPRLDGQRLLGEAVREGVFYPLYRNLFLLDAKEKIATDALREKFKQTYYLYLSQSSEYISCVERVLDRLESLKIKVLLFKGPVIDSFIYDGFFRPRLDLDMTVSGGQAALLEKGLVDLGYTAQEEKDYPIPEYLNSRVFTGAQDDLVPMHVHRHLINNMFLTVDGALSMSMDKVWGETMLFKNHHNIYMLKPELNIIYLCEHGLKHDFDQLVYLVEIERLIRHYGVELDWKKLVSLVQDFGLSRAVYYGLYFAREVLSAGIPEEALGALRPEKLTIGEKIFIKHTLNYKHRRYASYPVYLAMRKGMLRKAYFIFRTLFPPQFTLKSALVRLRRLILP